MAVAHQVIKWVLAKRYSRIAQTRDFPHEAQQAEFANLMVKGAQTAFGKEHGLEVGMTPTDFAQRVPLRSYEELYPYIERILKGEEHVLWPSKVSWFSKSSGTTNARSKFIPVTEESLEGCHYKAGKDMISLYMANFPDSEVLKGDNLAVGGALGQHPDYPLAQVGDISAVIMKNLPFWAQWLRSPGLDIALMPSWEEKLDAMAEATMKLDITSLSGVPTWTVSLLQRVTEMAGAKNILEVWPNLEVFLHGAVAFGPYRQLFKELIPKEGMHYMELYNASEGFFGIMDDFSKLDQMLLMMDYGIYYEFIPQEELDKAEPKTLTLDQVEQGKTYALVISTTGGLWRYMLGDTVRFTSVNPYRIKIVGRTKSFINAFGEELMVENAEDALAVVNAELGCLVKEFTAAPIYMDESGKGAHEWVIEFVTPPADLNTFIHRLDEELRKVNSDYDAKRVADIALQLPRVHVAPSGTFYQWLASKGKLGGQHKVPRLNNDRTLLEDILRFLA